MNQETPNAPSLPPLELGDLHRWVVGRGMQGLSVGEQIAGFCQRVFNSGFPMKRVSVGMYTLHPRFGSHTFTWRPEADGIEHIPRERALLSRDVYLKSPVHHMRSNGLLGLRRRLDGDNRDEFVLFPELRAEGLVDYAAQLVPYDPLQVRGKDERSDGAVPMADPDGELDGIFFSCATDRPEGFDDGQLNQVAEALPYLAISVKSRLTYDVASTVLETYLGRDAGKRGPHRRDPARLGRGDPRRHLVCRSARLHQADRQPAARTPRRNAR